jgi:hypothetical protein
MGVIIDYRDVSCLAHTLEAPLHPAEALQAWRHLVNARAHSEPRTESAERVQDVVASRDVYGDGAKPLVIEDKLENAPLALQLHFSRNQARVGCHGSSGSLTS